MGYKSPRTYTLNICNKSLLAPADATTYYFAGDVNTPGTVDGVATIVVPKTGHIRSIAIQIYSSTASGTNEDWTLVLENYTTTTDYTIATLGLAAARRLWNNENLNIPVTSQDLISIKTTTPTWATNPQGCLMTGTIVVDYA